MTITIDIANALQGIAVFLFLGLSIGIIALLFQKIRRFFASRAFRGTDREVMRQRWSAIEDMVKEKGDMHLKLALLEADKLLDHALKSLAMPGETLGDRLKFAQYKYPTLRQVWFAHKIRNNIAHEATYQLDARMARRAIAEFRRALTTLGAI